MSRGTIQVLKALTVVVALGGAVTALAAEHGHRWRGLRHSIPEFDPAAAGALAALIAGGALYVASKKRS